ncbi:MAG TPA: hypothetical protein VIQ31_05115 [Phormidium sp.]
MTQNQPKKDALVGLSKAVGTLIFDHSECTVTTLKLIEAIVSSLFLDEDSEERFLVTGFKAAIDLYEGSNMYWMGDADDQNADPENPCNWEGYDKYLELVKQEKFAEFVKKKNTTEEN